MNIELDDRKREAFDLIVQMQIDKSEHASTMKKLEELEKQAYERLMREWQCTKGELAILWVKYRTEKLKKGDEEE